MCSRGKIAVVDSRCKFPAVFKHTSVEMTLLLAACLDAAVFIASFLFMF